MDCTYKTNRYKEPLLDIIGVSCFNTSFYSGFAFLEKEDTEGYIWALSAFQKIFEQMNQTFVIMSDRELALMNAIKTVFPSAINLLCVWHIEKNILANCKKYFRSTEEFDMFLLSWNDVVYSKMKDIYINNWSEFELLYSEKKDAIEYIKKVWLPCKEKFASAWTKKYLHFGNRTSSRAEGAHAKLKLYLQNSKGNFQEVKRKMCLAIEHEFNEIKIRLASERIQIPHNCNMPIFRDLLSNVSRFALEKIYEQYDKAKLGNICQH